MNKCTLVVFVYHHSITNTVSFLGGWWEVTNFDELTGPVSIEHQSMCYMQAQDNGTFSMSNSHAAGMISLSNTFIVTY